MLKLKAAAGWCQWITGAGEGGPTSKYELAGPEPPRRGVIAAGQVCRGAGKTRPA